MKRIFGLIVLLVSVPAFAGADTLCDPRYQNCRIPLVALIDHEKTAIDVFMWFMQDNRYVAALQRAQNRGVQVRVLANARWASTNINMVLLKTLADARIPIRVKATSGMLHTKAMMFHSQMVVEHGGANFTPTAFRPNEPYVNYIDEIVQFNNDPAVVLTYMTSFDSWWTNTTHFRNYANVHSISRMNAPFAKDPRVQISTPSDPYTYRKWMVARIDAERVGLDAIQYRITDSAIVDAVIRAHKRGVPVRVITDPKSMTWSNHGYYETKMRNAGVPIKRRVHEGLTHEKFVLFYGQHLVEFGSQHWTAPEGAIEHNLWTSENDAFDWGKHHFSSKWNSQTEFR